MIDITRSSFLTRSDGGEDSKLVRVKFNSGVSKPMRYARKRCLDEANRITKHQNGTPPTIQEWRHDQNLFSIDTIEELFGSFDAMINKVQTYYQSKPRNSAEIKETVLTGEELKSYRSEISPGPFKSDVVHRKRKSEHVSRIPRRWTDEQLAEFLLEACGKQRSFINIGQYNVWRAQQLHDCPSSPTISHHLGNGRWSQEMFDRAREIIAARE